MFSVLQCLIPSYHTGITIAVLIYKTNKTHPWIHSWNQPVRYDGWYSIFNGLITWSHCARC